MTSRPQGPSPDFRALFEASPGLCLAVASDAPTYTIVAVTHAYARAIALPREALLGRGLLELLSSGPTGLRPGDVLALADSLQRVVTGHATDEIGPRKFVLLRPEQPAEVQERWWRTVHAPVFASGGELAYIVHHIEDVTQAQERMAELDRAQWVAEVGSWRLDVRHDQLRWSDELHHIFGIPPVTALSYETFLSRVHPDDRAYVDARWAAALRGEPYDIEHRILVGDRVKWVREKAQLEFDADGAVVGGIGIAQDITERKRLEEALRLAEARSSGILSISSDAIVTIDEAQRITMFNEGAEKIFGYAKEEAIGAPLDLLIPPRFRAAHREHVERFAAGQEVARRMGVPGATIVGLRKNGEEFPADAAVSKLEVAGRRILTATLRDITERKRVEHQEKFLAEIAAVLSESLEQQDTVRRLAQLVVREIADWCIVDLVEEDGQVRRAEVALAAPDEADTAALTGRYLEPSRPYLTWTVIRARRAQTVTEQALARGELIVHGDVPARTRDALRARLVIGVPVVAHGRLLGVLVAGARRRDGQLGPAVVRLLEDVASRAAFALDNARLYDQVRRAVRERDDVLGIVAHDLRNPLGTILMQVQLLRAGEAEAEADRPAGEAAERIERAARRMSRLIQDLLDVTRLEAGRLALQQRAVPADRVVIDAIDAQRTLAGSSSIELRLEVAGELPAVWADRDRLLQAFENLLGNAMKFTAPGGVIAAGAAARDDDVLFWVADTGPGIAAEDLPHIFDRFWQARHVDRGAGLGLPIVKGIVEAHGGRIWVDATPGRGSTFYFTVPTARPAPEAQRP